MKIKTTAKVTSSVQRRRRSVYAFYVHLYRKRIPTCPSLSPLPPPTYLLCRQQPLLLLSLTHFDFRLLFPQLFPVLFSFATSRRKLTKKTFFFFFLLLVLHCFISFHVMEGPPAGWVVWQSKSYRFLHLRTHKS